MFRAIVPLLVQYPRKLLFEENSNNRSSGVVSIPLIQPGNMDSFLISDQLEVSNQTNLESKPPANIIEPSLDHATSKTPLFVELFHRSATNAPVVELMTLQPPLPLVTTSIVPSGDTSMS